jgi:glutamate dehydrogenase (NAD(P)+)
MDDAFRYADELGPKSIIHIHRPVADLRAILVVDNVACGPAIGGVRMAPDVSLEECFRLARAMTFKSAAAGLSHGGGKAVIFADARMAADDKERLIRAFAHAIAEVTDYIPGPDMGTDERCMAWTEDEIGRAAGLPRAFGGIPLDEIGATGFGLAVTAEVAAGFCDLALDGARVAVQGFGAVGRHAARFLAERGAVLVAAADSHGTAIDARGLDIERLSELKAQGKSVTDYGGETGDADAVVGVACDIWIPAARPDVLRADNVDRLDAKLVLQGANIPATAEAEDSLHARGILCVPDFIANAGGLICAAVEYGGGTETAAFETIAEKVRANVHSVLERAREEGWAPRAAAVAIAEERVRAATALRRFG